MATDPIETMTERHAAAMAKIAEGIARTDAVLAQIEEQNRQIKERLRALGR